MQFISPWFWQTINFPTDTHLSNHCYPHIPYLPSYRWVCLWIPVTWVTSFGVQAVLETSMGQDKTIIRSQWPMAWEMICSLGPCELRLRPVSLRHKRSLSGHLVGLGKKLHDSQDLPFIGALPVIPLPPSHPATHHLHPIHLHIAPTFLW